MSCRGNRRYRTLEECETEREKKELPNNKTHMHTRHISTIHTHHGEEQKKQKNNRHIQNCSARKSCKHWYIHVFLCSSFLCLSVSLPLFRPGCGCCCVWFVITLKIFKFEVPCSSSSSFRHSIKYVHSVVVVVMSLLFLTSSFECFYFFCQFLLLFRNSFPHWLTHVWVLRCIYSTHGGGGLLPYCSAIHSVASCLHSLPISLCVCVSPIVWLVPAKNQK